MIGRILDIQRCCVNDGPGLRTTVLLKGCGLRCAWCPMPEAQAATPELLVDGSGCMACGGCVQVCPHAADNAATPLDMGRRCLVCGRCVAACPCGVRRVAGEGMYVDSLLPLLLKDCEGYGSAGGVTFGGGEPLLQWEFVRSAADRLRVAGVHVAVETGCVAREQVIRRLPVVADLVLARLAVIDAARHREWLGCDNRAILESIAALAEALPGRLWLRIPLVPDLHDFAEIERLAVFAAGLPHAVPVCLEPYRANTGVARYLAQREVKTRFAGPTSDLARIARGVFIARGAHLLDA
jgi:pyruvate formate lyase activating enzyme